MTNEQLELAINEIAGLTSKGFTNTSASINHLIEISKLLLSRLEVLERKINQ